LIKLLKGNVELNESIQIQQKYIQGSHLEEE
jgi:hypothetical protein